VLFGGCQASFTATRSYFSWGAGTPAIVLFALRRSV
jgi:hypothetical protein